MPCMDHHHQPVDHDHIPRYGQNHSRVPYQTPHLHCHEFCHEHPVPIQERILEIITQEQEYLSRILAALAVKVEKTANWLPDALPDEPFNQVIDKVKSLECVIGQEIDAVAKKELAIEKLVKQICHCPIPPGPEPKPHGCICPCHLYQSCKVVGRCLLKGSA